MAEQSIAKRIDKVRGSMIGGAVGDALGYQIEFHQGVTPKMVTRFNGKIGIISDDTQMTLFTACGLLWRETREYIRGIAMLPPEAIYLAYLDWLETQQRIKEHVSISWIKDIPELNVLRDPGITCLGALSSDKAGTLGEPINNSKGCGGVMRIAPIALYLNEDVVGEFSAKSCALTHGHPLAILSAYTLGYIIYYALSDYPMEKAIETAIKKMNNWTAEGVDKDHKPIKIQYKNEKVELTELFNKAIRLAESDVEDQNAIRQLGMGWVADEAVAIAIYCSLKYKDNFEDAIVAAANHDGDSDSTAAITGNIVGARVGYKNIPDYYKNNVELKDIILELSDDLANGIPIKEDEKGHTYPTDEWLDKYVYLKHTSRV